MGICVGINVGAVVGSFVGRLVGLYRYKGIGNNVTATSFHNLPGYT